MIASSLRNALVCAYSGKKALYSPSSFFNAIRINFGCFIHSSTSYDFKIISNQRRDCRRRHASFSIRLRSRKPSLWALCKKVWKKACYLSRCFYFNVWHFSNFDFWFFLSLESFFNRPFFYSPWKQHRHENFFYNNWRLF